MKKPILIEENENFRALKRKGYQTTENHRKIYHPTVHFIEDKLLDKVVWSKKGGKPSVEELRAIESKYNLKIAY
tara:strand:+ start:629 stop:850 length:222 start_codon:yes stop_codon:yes gene_type:complete